jgi:hypothetical protein
MTTEAIFDMTSAELRATGRKSLTGSEALKSVPRAYAHGLGILNGRQSRNLATATYARLADDGRIVIDYRGTDVVTFAPNGAVILDNGGWPTMTTKRRMDAALQGIVNGYVSGYVLRHGELPKSSGKNPWRVTVRTDDEGSRADVIDFVEHDSTVYIEQPYNPYFWVSPFNGRPGMGTNYGDAPRLVAVLTPAILSTCPEPSGYVAETSVLGTFGDAPRPCAVCGVRDKRNVSAWTSLGPARTFHHYETLCPTHEAERNTR